MPDHQRAQARQARREELGQQLLYEGRCLAIFIAPSFDAYGRRFSPLEYAAQMRDFTSFFDEIALACAERIADRKEEKGGNATEAFESIVKDIGKPDAPDRLETFYEEVTQRARYWRYGDGE
ncbi:hypothetical protein D2V17_14395 [Aurantiacibacter xanthus]|uniref:Uncharacterized protein n=1 Tax=Aurantiacibacter xanthus TaxID=1784712 RepID=A0A3A1P3A9_9SPHN|nr:hypothetical protein D2V17_14395 [Aurantiacibacter xanthus]